MHPAAIDKARSRLRVARRAIEDMKAAQDIGSFDDAWYVFLTAAKNIYESLKIGANTTTPQSRQWYGAKARERKGDPLLQYIYEARNADEHGLSASVERRPGNISIPGLDPNFANAIQIDGFIGPGGFLRVKSLDGKPVPPPQITPPHIVLVSVTARGGRVYAPPQAHLGQPLPSNRPVPVAELAASYLEALVEEASRLT